MNEWIQSQEMRMWCMLKKECGQKCGCKQPKWEIGALFIRSFVEWFLESHIYENHWKCQYFHFSIDNSVSIYMCDWFVFTENTFSTRQNVTTTFKRENRITVRSLTFRCSFMVSVEIKLIIWPHGFQTSQSVTRNMLRCNNEILNDKRLTHLMYIQIYNLK